QLHAPVAQVGQHDRLAGNGAAHEVAGRQHLELAVEEPQPCFALEAEQLFEAIHAVVILLATLGARTLLEHTDSAPAAPPSFIKTANPGCRLAALSSCVAEGSVAPEAA